WSSDVCSSDLRRAVASACGVVRAAGTLHQLLSTEHEVEIERASRRARDQEVRQSAHALPTCVGVEFHRRANQGTTATTLRIAQPGATETTDRALAKKVARDGRAPTAQPKTIGN